jgi:mannose-6-phosphate isomerase-like protein (cupin superfamily)
MTMDETDLRKLNSAVEFLVEGESFSSAVERLKAELVQSTETFVWATVDLTSIPCELPEGIKSCWIFYLRKDMPSGRHYHPNSVQHMVVVEGQGTSNIGGERRVLVPFRTPGRSLADKWLIIGQGVPHEFIPEREDMTVVSFHTCAASELEEIECKTGGSRLYEGPDA